jgi:hypothetical protein
MMTVVTLALGAGVAQFIGEMPRQRSPRLRASLSPSRSACLMISIPPSRYGRASELIWGSYFRMGCS